MMDCLKVFWRNNKKPLILNLAFLALAAVALVWFLEYRYFLNSAGRAWQFFWERPLVFWYNVFLMFVGLVLITALVRRPIIAASLVWALILVVGYIHINKFNARGFPLLPEDFILATEATSLAKFVDMGGLVRLIIAVILSIILGVILQAWHGKKLEFKKLDGKKKTSWMEKRAIGARAILLLCSGIIFVGATDFVRNHNGQRYEDIPWLNSQLVAWNQVRNYDYNGFLMGFLYNLQKLKLEEPAGYSPERMAEIRESYAMLKARDDKERPALADDDINIVVILNESFFDPGVTFQGESFETYYPHEGGEILPTLRRVQSKYPSSYMYSTDYGGGTANIELEVLTGLTNFFTNTVPYTDLIPHAGATSSIASYLKTQGYATTAIHPFNGSMYKRNIVFENFGYDNFITELEMDYSEKEGNAEYINDRSAYLQVLDVLKEKDKQFVTLITMQNHLPYNSDIYEETDFKLTNINLEEWKRDEIAIYYQMLHESDKYLGEFLEALDNSDEKTAVLFFGDHSAGIFELTNGHEKKEVRDLSRLTPYFVYTNYDLGGKKTGLGMTTPNCLSNALFDILGAQKPRINYLLDKVCVETPILANAWLGENGATMSPSLIEYELVSYDVFSGKKNWE